MSTAPRTRRPTLAVIGNGTLAPGSKGERLAEEVGRRAIDAGFRLVTGGLGGVMAAASRGAHTSEAYREGDVVGLLPGPDPAAANEWVDVALATGLGEARNLVVANSDVVVAIGGGAGTLSEMAFAWMRRRPVIALGTDGWSAELADRALDPRTDHGAPDPARIHRARDPQHAIELALHLEPLQRARHGGRRDG